MAPVIRPWRTERQLIDVGKQFYKKAKAEDRDSRVAACEMVQVWKFRGDVPHSISSTSSLMQAVLHDEQTLAAQPDGPIAPIVTNSIVCTYAIAVIHFVTGYTDTEQTKKDKISMYKAAESLGLPYQFVDLRNDIVHTGRLPLAELRQSTQLALKWLWENYWMDVVGREPIVQEIENRPYKAMLELERLTIKLNAIVDGFAGFIRSCTGSDSSSKTEAVEEEITKCANEVQRLCGNRKQSLLLFADLLSSDAGFQQSISNAPTSSTTRDYWDRFLIEIASIQSNFVREFSNALVRQLSTSASSNKEEIINMNLYERLMYPWLSQHWALARQGSRIEAAHILNICLASPNQWTLKAAETTLERYEHELADPAVWRRRLNATKAL